MNEDMTNETLTIKYYVTGEGTLVHTNGDLPDGVTQITEEEYSKAIVVLKEKKDATLTSSPTPNSSQTTSKPKRKLTK